MYISDLTTGLSCSLGGDKKYNVRCCTHLTQPVVAQHFESL